MRPILLTLLLAAAPALAAPASYSVTDRIAGPDGPWDYAKVDPQTHRLFVARGNAVTVVDLSGTSTATSIGAVTRGHAVVPLDGGRLLVTSGNDGTVRFLDIATGKQLASVTVGKKPDAAILDAPRHRAFVMNSDSGTVSILDTTAMTVTGTITVKPALEYAALSRDGTLFINNEDANELEVVDVAKGKLVKSIALTGCEGPTGLGYDAVHDRLVSACANGKAAVVDAKTRRLVATLPIGKGADAVIVDEARHLAFVPCGGDSVLDVLDLSGLAVRSAGRVTTEIGARTGALDPATGAIYLPTAKFSPPTTPGGRPVAVPGSFHILAVRPAAAD